MARTEKGEKTPGHLDFFIMSDSNLPNRSRGYGLVIKRQKFRPPVLSELLLDNSVQLPLGHQVCTSPYTFEGSRDMWRQKVLVLRSR